MLELRLSQGVLLKKILESVKDLLSNVNFDCSPSDGLCLQSMDSSHVALVSLQLLPHSFERFRCDHNLSMGINLAHLSRLLKCAANEDVITIKADDQNPDTMSLMFENPSELFLVTYCDQLRCSINFFFILSCYQYFLISEHDRISDFEMKLMDIESEHLHIPDTSYEATVRMPSQEFARICKDLSTIGDTGTYCYLFEVVTVSLHSCSSSYCDFIVAVTISITKEGVKFSVSGAIGNANIICRHNISVVKVIGISNFQYQSRRIHDFYLGVKK